MSSQPTLPQIEPSIRQEIGVMLGFMAIFALVITSFAITWKAKNKKQAEREDARAKELTERGFGPRDYGVGEKEKGVVREVKEERRERI